MKITEYADYMTGKKHFPARAKEPFRASEEFAKEILKEAKTHYAFEHNIEHCNTPKAFFESMPDLAQAIPKVAQVEAFYILKSGLYSKEVPAMVLYALEECKKMGSFNMFTKLFTKAQLETIFSENSLANGYSVRDVICTIYDKNFKAITDYELKSPNSEGFTDIYIASTDMIAIIPNKIAERLSTSDIKEIKVSKKLLMVGDTPIYKLGGYYGASNSTYDLRNLR